MVTRFVIITDVNAVATQNEVITTFCNVTTNLVATNHFCIKASCVPIHEMYLRICYPCVWPRTIYLSWGWSAARKPSRGVSREWVYFSKPPENEIDFLQKRRGENTGINQWLYPCPANIHRRVIPEVSTRQTVPDRKNLALDFRFDFLLQGTRKQRFHVNCMFNATKETSYKHSYWKRSLRHNYKVFDVL